MIERTACARHASLRCGIRPPGPRHKPVAAQCAVHGAQLAVVGSINVDTVLKLDRLPEAGETIAAHGIQQFPGGKGANQAAAAAMLGCETAMIGQVGSDGGADFMLSHLLAHRVHTDGTIQRLDKEATGSALVMLLPGGENSIVIVGGANTAHWHLSQEQQDVILQSKMVLLQREIPDSVNLQVAQMCKTSGVDVILDAGGAEGPLDAELLSCVSLLSPNETELARMAEMQIRNAQDVLAACKKLQEQGARDILVKLGSRGSVLFTSSGDIVEQPAVPVKNVADTTGAGDCFTAAFAVARVRGLEVKEALHFASTAAALCIQSVGAMSSMPSSEQVQASLT